MIIRRFILLNLVVQLSLLSYQLQLCLMSGEIIQLAPTTNLIFEPMDLEVASPATVSATHPSFVYVHCLCVLLLKVSRCGMIYMEPHMLGWQPLFQSWIATLPGHLKDQHTVITQLYNRIVPPCVDFVRKAGFKVRYIIESGWANYGIYNGNLYTACIL